MLHKPSHQHQQRARDGQRKVSPPGPSYMSDNQIGKKLVIWECAESLHSCVTEAVGKETLSFMNSCIYSFFVFFLLSRGNLNADAIALNLFQLAT